MVKYVIQCNDSLFKHKKKYWSYHNNTWVSSDLCSPFSRDIFGVYFNTRQDAYDVLNGICDQYPLATIETVSTVIHNMF